MVLFRDRDDNYPLNGQPSSFPVCWPYIVVATMSGSHTHNLLGGQNPHPIRVGSPSFLCSPSEIYNL